MKQLNDAAGWKGYTLEELYMRRAEIFARKEIEKYRLSLSLDNMRRTTPLLGGRSGESGGKTSNWFSYLEYALVAYRVVRRVMPFFRRKK